MIIKKKTGSSKRIVDCHHGKGVLWCTEMLADYKKIGSGFKFIHDNYLEPGASIGEHQHENNEEIYVILSGRGTMTIDAVKQDVGPGDICLTRNEHSHDLTNGLEGPMHFLVICANT